MSAIMCRGAWRLVMMILPMVGLLIPGIALAAPDISFPGGSVTFSGGDEPALATPLKIVLLLTLLSLAPTLLIVLTGFTRIVIVLSMLRHAIGMPQTPPNSVLVSLALVLTAFTMMPVWNQVNETAVQPYMDKQISDRDFLERAMQPIRKFMAAQTNESDILLVLNLSEKPAPKTLDDLDTMLLVPAFMLSELRTAFEIGFVIFLPFVVIDLIVASTLMSLGMIMVPPLAFSLPLKVLMFVLIDGWRLLTESLVRSFVV